MGCFACPLFILMIMATKKTTKKEVQEKVLVVIPYFAAGAQGRELEYSVAGWRKHFLTPHQIIVIGDYHPIVDTGDDITFIDCPRVDDIPGQYRPHIDHVHKFRMVKEHYPDSKGFIYTCDDIYAVNDFTMAEVLFLKKEHDHIIPRPTGNAWQRDQYKTMLKLYEENLPVVNYICHLPVYLEWDKLFEIYEKYDCDHNSYVVENLYFNTYYSNRPALKMNIDYDNIKCGVHRPNPRISYIRDAFTKKLWIQNSVEGWIPELERLLKEHYGIK